MGIWSRISEVVRHVFDARNAKRFSAKPFSVFNLFNLAVLCPCECLQMSIGKSVAHLLFNSPLQGVVLIDVFVTLVLFGCLINQSQQRGAIFCCLQCPDERVTNRDESFGIGVNHGVALACTVAHAETECAARLVGWPAYPRGSLSLNYLHRSSRSDSRLLTCFSQGFCHQVSHHSASFAAAAQAALASLVQNTAA